MLEIENNVGIDTENDCNYEGEGLELPRFPRPVDIDDGIERDITIKQEIFGEIFQHKTKFEVMRFTLSNKGRDAIQVQVLSLGAALYGITAPDRKGVYRDVVLGFDDPEMYRGPMNLGFGRITSFCPLPYSLEKIVWDWDFDRDEGSVTFSTAFYNTDLILSVKYTLTVCNEIIIDMKACGSKILPISLTNQVYWNLAGHYKGEEAMKHHVLTLNSDRIWKHVNHHLKNFIPIRGTNLDFRIPTLMDNPLVFGDKAFEHVYIVSKGSKQTMCFLARLIHPRSCRYVEIFSDQPWMLCHTLNEMPKAIDQSICEKRYGEVDGEEGEGRKGDRDEVCSDAELDKMSCSEILKESENQKDEEPCSDNGGSREGEGGEFEESQMTLPSIYMEELPGKEGAFYKKYGSFCITPLSDLTGFDPILRPGSHYSHRIIYKIGVYRRYMRRLKLEVEIDAPETIEGIVDIEAE